LLILNLRKSASDGLLSARGALPLSPSSPTDSRTPGLALPIPSARRLSQGLSLRIEPKDPKALTLVRASTPPAQSSVVQQASVARRRSRALEEGMVAFAEPVAIILNRRRRHRGIAEVWMLFHAWTQITRYITPRGFESIMEPLTGDLAKFRRGRRSGINSNRPRMRTPGHGKGQEQGTHHNPFLHVFHPRVSSPALR
jgi:hypothetical protein